MGKRIKAIRESLGKSQSEFGKLFNPPAPKSAVSRWEHGGSPNNKRLSDIAELGGISVAELIYGTLEESIYNILDEIYPLYTKWLDVTSGSSWENFVSLAENEEQRSIYRNLSRMFTFLEEDYYDDTSSTSDKGISSGLEVCAHIALEQAKKLKISPANKPMLIRLISKAAERHWSGETATNTGIFNIINNELNSARKKISHLTYGLEKEENFSQAKHSTKINEEYMKEINSLINETQHLVYKISAKYDVQ